MLYTYINPQMSESVRFRVSSSRPPAHVVVGHTTMGVYDDEDAVRDDVDMEEEEEEIGQVRACDDAR